MSTFGEHYSVNNTRNITIVERTGLGTHLSFTPFTTSTHKPKPEETEVEKSLSRLLEKNAIDEEYIVDYFTQEAIFEDQKDGLRKKHAGKLLLVCGGDILVGDDLDKLKEQAQAKYPDRPFFSHSFGSEYMLF